MSDMSIRNNAMESADHPYWGRLASTTMSYVDYLTNSNDMIVEVVPDTRPLEEQEAEQIIPAYFVPSERRIFIDASTAFRDEVKDISYYDIDISRRMDRNFHPLFTGMLAHEVGHEKYTGYSFASETSDGSPVTSLERKIVELLEESRMEKRLLDDHPDPACYLASCAHNVILKPLFEKFVLGLFERNEALSMFLLIRVRMILGIVPKSFIPPVINDKMNELLSESNNSLLWNMVEHVLPLVEDNDYDKMVAIARSVIKFLGLTDEEPENPCQTHQDQSSEPQTDDAGNSSPESPKPGTGDSTASEGEEKDGESKTSQQGNQKPQTTSKKPLTQGQKEVLEKILDQAQQGIGEHQEEIKESGENNASTMENNNHGHLQDFEEVTEEEQEKHLRVISTTSTFFEAPMPKVYELIPTIGDRVNAQTLYEDIRQAQYRADTISHIPVDKPQGKMVMRQAVRRSIQRDMGVEVTAKPWNRMHHEQQLNPPLIMGVAMDVSHSLKEYIPAFMRYMWSLNEAILMNSGEVHNILWGKDNVTFEHHRQIVQVPCSPFSGKSEGLPHALQKLAYNCNFHRASGAKIAFVITDSSLPNTDDIVNELRILESLDVKVIWISTTEMNREIFSSHAHYIYMDNPHKFYEIMSPQVVQALENPMLTSVI